MSANKFINGWSLVAALLIIIITIGIIVIWSKFAGGHPVEISLVPERELWGGVYVGGEVNNPGIYPLEAGDGIVGIIRGAGGTTDNADLDRLELYVPGLSPGESAQKVNINRAEAWLLGALPGIGQVRAQAIISYRQQNGRFQNTSELLKVDGIGTATYEQIEHLITVGD